MQPAVLSTAGAGFAGSNLCRFLLARGYAVRSLGWVEFQHAERTSVDVMQGASRDPVAVAHAMRGVGTAIDPVTAAPSSEPEEIFSTGVAGTWTVWQTAIREHVNQLNRSAANLANHSP